MGNCKSVCIGQGDPLSANLKIDPTMSAVMVGVGEAAKGKIIGHAKPYSVDLISPVTADTMRSENETPRSQVSLVSVMTDSDYKVRRSKQNSITSKQKGFFKEDSETPTAQSPRPGNSYSPKKSREAKINTPPSLRETDDLDSVIPEEEDPRAPSDEEESVDEMSPFSTDDHLREMVPNFNVIKARGKVMTRTGPESIIHYPTLVAPPPEEARILASIKKRDAVNATTMAEFNKLKIQAEVSKKQRKAQKRLAKLEDRTEDVKGYNNLWKGFKAMKREVSESSLQQLEQQEQERKSQSEEKQPKQQRETRANGKRRKSFDLQNTEKWFVDFTSIEKNNNNREDDNNSQNGLSLLSEASMEAQRRLYAEKRKQRQRKDAEIRGRSKRDTSSTPQKNKTDDATHSTPEISPPKLQVYTGGRKVTNCDYGPQRSTNNSAGNSADVNNSFTDMEVSFRPKDSNGLETGTSLSRVSSFNDDERTDPISDIECDNDYKVTRRVRRRGRQGRDDYSQSGSSYQSLATSGGGSKYGSPARGSSNNKKGKRDNGENVIQGLFLECMFNQCDETSKQLSALRSSDKEAKALRDRILELEQKFGLDQPGTNPKSAMQPVPDVVGPILSPLATQTPLQPAQLDGVFRKQYLTGNSASSPEDTGDIPMDSASKPKPEELGDIPMYSASKSSQYEQELGDIPMQSSASKESAQENDYMQREKQPRSHSSALKSSAFMSINVQESSLRYELAKKSREQTDSKETGGTEPSDEHHPAPDFLRTASLSTINDLSERSSNMQGADLKETIVMHNVSKCVENIISSRDNKTSKKDEKKKPKDTIRFMTKDEFLHIADDHALVQVVKLQTGALAIRRASSGGSGISKEEAKELADISFTSEDSAGEVSLANDIADEVDTILNRIREGKDLGLRRDYNRNNTDESGNDNNGKIQRSPSYVDEIANDEIFEIQYNENGEFSPR